MTTFDRACGGPDAQDNVFVHLVPPRHAVVVPYADPVQLHIHSYTELLARAAAHLASIAAQLDTMGFVNYLVAVVFG